MLLLLTLTACGYSVEAWWTDLAQAHCDCEYTDQQRSDCVDEQLEIYASTPEWEACHDDPAPVSRGDVSDWIDEYTETCDAPVWDPPLPEDPSWAEGCEG